MEAVHVGHALCAKHKLGLNMSFVKTTCKGVVVLSFMHDATRTGEASAIYLLQCLITKISHMEIACIIVFLQPSIMVGAKPCMGTLLADMDTRLTP